MKFKKLASLALSAAMAATLLSGCGGGSADNNSSGTTEAAVSTTESGSDTGSDSGSDTASSGEVNHDETYTVDFYNVAANFQGIQPGWYGKIVKDKFNMELNIIAPQVAGDGGALYQTRCASGNLGDLIILDNGPASECVESGLIMDLTDIIKNYPNLMKFQSQIEQFNSQIGDGSKIYCIPLEMNNNGPTDYKQLHVYTYPRMGWDMYTEAGSPDLQNLDDLLNCLKKIQDAHPTNENGDPAYAISLWKDWDSQYSENVAQLTVLYLLEQITQSSLLQIRMALTTRCLSSYIRQIRWVLLILTQQHRIGMKSLQRCRIRESISTGTAGSMVSGTAQPEVKKVLTMLKSL